MRYSIQYDLGSDIMFNISLRSCRQIEPIIYIYLPYSTARTRGLGIPYCKVKGLLPE